MSDFTVLSDSDAALLEKLKEFYAGVKGLALNAEMVVPCDTEGNPGAAVGVIFPYQLGPLLDKIDPNWTQVENA